MFVCVTLYLTNSLFSFLLIYTVLQVGYSQLALLEKTLMQDRPSIYSSTSSSSRPAPSPVSPLRSLADMQSSCLASSDCVEDASYSGSGIGVGEEDSSRDFSRSQVSKILHLIDLFIFIFFFFFFFFYYFFFSTSSTSAPLQSSAFVNFQGYNFLSIYSSSRFFNLMIVQCDMSISFYLPMRSSSDFSNFNIIQSWKYYNDSQPPTRTTSQEEERVRDRDERDGCRDRYRERERERERDLELENNMKRGGWDELKRTYKQHSSSSSHCIVLPVSTLSF